ncbi:MAG: Gfo/Idh/MocA family oxidoreductase [Verrucomicrobia bacterium]|nr:Gfo/Idh/MocA family oxidoreductase [Verrucomicrobiota bacterium]
MKIVKTAIIGTGGIAVAHVQADRSQNGRAQIAAAMDIDESRVNAFCTTHAIPQAYTHLDALLAEQKPELVHICTPPGTHAALSIQCLEAGAWVLCEKPLCGSLAEMDRIEDAERRTGRYCSSVFQWRFGSGVRHLKRLIQSNAMGRPLVGICQTTWYRDHEYYKVPWRGKWNTELGGPTMGLGIHAMDAFLWLLGGWKEVRAMMGTLDRRIEVEDVSMATVRFENGAMGSIVNSCLCPRQESYLRFDFQRSTVELRSLYGYANKDWQYSIPKKSDDAEMLEQWKAIPAEVPSSHGSQVACLLDCMERHERPLVSGPEARKTIEFLTALYKSAVTGQIVTQGSVSKGDPFYQKIHGSAAEKFAN